MVSRAGRAVVAALAVAASGCLDDSAVPLGPASQGVIEPRLLGSWTCTGTEENAEPGILTFLRFDETQYLIQVHGEADEEASYLRAYSSTLGDLPFLNSQELQGGGSEAERGWTFTQYALAEDGGLTLRAVPANVFENRDDSIASARQALEDALGDPEALSSFLSCTRRQPR